MYRLNRHITATVVSSRKHLIHRLRLCTTAKLSIESESNDVRKTTISTEEKGSIYKSVLPASDSFIKRHIGPGREEQEAMLRELGLKVCVR